MKVVELREYRIKPGKTKEWLDWMREEIFPYQISKGMNILDTYLRTDENGRDYFVWLREFESESSRQTIYLQTYNDWWIKEVRPRVFSLIDEDSVSVKLIQPLDLF
ncbi:hypothetical protein [Vibrio caribbeanicus]|uniref:hypothetical protein n=1 Tax=Vibrio caribbeanicus TaxID=701175 RepID=UPI0030DAB2D6